MRLKFVFLIATLTAGSIIIFQIYWVYQTYQTTESNFKKTILNSLQNSIDSYQLRRSNLPYSLNLHLPYLSVVESISDTNHVFFPDEQKGLVIPKKKFHISFEPFRVTPENMAMVKLIMAKLAVQSEKRPVEIQMISRLLKKELEKNGIPISYQLFVGQDQKQLPADAIVAHATFGKKKVVLVVVLPSARQYLLKQELLPGGISLLLVFLSAGSLWYMGKIIQRQIWLDKIKNDFIGNLTHELKTPVSILKSTNEALYQFGEIGNPEKAMRYLKINASVLDKLDENIDRILDISRYENGMKKIIKVPVDLDELVNEVLQKLDKDELGRLNYHFLKGVNTVLTDRYMMETIITNLIDNAIKYTTVAPAINLETKLMDHGWELHIKDNGIGISEQYIPMIFDKFYRIPSGDLHEVKGYGIGLSHVKQLVDSLKGRISVISKPGAGSTFIIYFPK